MLGLLGKVYENKLFKKFFKTIAKENIVFELETYLGDIWNILNIKVLMWIFNKINIFAMRFKYRNKLTQTSQLKNYDKVSKI